MTTLERETFENLFADPARRETAVALLRAAAEADLQACTEALDALRQRLKLLDPSGGLGEAVERAEVALGELIEPLVGEGYRLLHEQTA